MSEPTHADDRPAPVGPCPDGEYGPAWTELRGYVQQAKNDGDQINPADLLTYMDELRRRALAPVAEWIRKTRGDTP